MEINEIIVIGGGKSILEGLNSPSNPSLQARLKDKCVITVNYAYKHFPSTFLTFIDRDFYKSTHLDKNPDIFKELGNLPLIIGLKINPTPTQLHPNTIMIPCPKKEIASICSLTGLFALAIADKLEPKNIFLMGYDWTRSPNHNPTKRDNVGKTNIDIHYYKKEIQHRGLGYTGFYNNHNPDFYFKHFSNSKSKIYNVSPKSNITVFKKIDYSEFYSLLSNEKYNQDELRQYIKQKLNCSS